MSSFVSTIELPASPAASWAFVIEHAAELEPLQFEPLGEQGVGTVNRITGRFVGVPIRGVSRTVQWDPPDRCAFESVKPSWPIRAFILETFEASEVGTRHTIDYEVRATGLIGNAVAPVMCLFMRRNRRVFQERLRAGLLASDR